MENRTIYGTDRDTIDSRDYLTPGEVERLKAAGVELDAREKRVLQAVADQVFARQRMAEHRAALARLDADADAAEAQRKAALKVGTASHPSSPDDFLIITDHASPFQLFIDPYELRDSREVPRRELVVRSTGFMGCHWVARDIAERVIENLPQHRLPFNYYWQSTPDDLLDAIYRAGSWQAPFAAHQRRGMTSDGVLQVDAQHEVDWTGIVRFASKVVDGCFDVPTLHTWLVSADSTAGIHGTAFAAKCRKRLKDLGADEKAQAAE